MPTYEITAPDGKTYEVTGSGTADEALKHIQSLHGGAPAPAAPMPTPTWGQRGMEALQGAKGRFDEMALGVKGLLPQSVQDLGDRIDKATGHGQLTKETAVPVPDTWAGTAGSIVPDVLATAAPAGLVSMAGRAVGRALPGAVSLAGRAVAGGATNLAGQAGISAALTPEDRGNAALMGAGGAALGAGLQRAAGGLIRPLVTPAAQRMMDRGVQVTPGQAIGGSALDIEKKLTSIPFIGERIRGAHNRALGEHFTSTTGEMVGGLPQSVRSAVAAAEPGNEAMSVMRHQIGQQYDNALGQVAHVPIDATETLRHAVNAVNDPGLALNDASKQRVLDYVANHVLGREPGAANAAQAAGNLSGEAAKRIESDLGKVASNWSSSGDAEQRSMGQAMQAIHKNWRSNVTAAVNQVDPRAGATLREADRAWAAFQPMDRASASMGAQAAEGVPQPRALLSAMKALDKSQNDNRLRGIIASGSARNPYERLVQSQQLGNEVFGAAVPDSGTSGRLVAIGALGAGSALSGGLAPVAGAAAGYGAAALAYSRLGSRLLTQGVAPDMAKSITQFAAQHGIPPDIAAAQVPNIVAAMGRQGGTQ